MSGPDYPTDSPLGCRGLRLSVSLSFFIFLVMAPLAVSAGEIALLAPFSLNSKVLSRNKIVNVVIKVTEAADLDLVTVVDDRDNDLVEPGGRHVKDSVYYVHYRLHLKKGTNNYTLMPGNLQLSIRYTPLSSLLNVNFDDPALYRFHRRETIPGECSGCHTEKLPADAVIDKVRYGQFSPECYSCHSSTATGSEWRHFPASAMLCRTCHQSTGDDKQMTIPTGRIEGLCFDCHVNNKKWSAMTHIHGPVGTGDCTICHDPHGSGNEFQLWADGNGKLCVVCHEGMRKYLELDKKGFVAHGIINAQGCGACHSPHASNHRFQLSGEINELCVRCHLSFSASTADHPVQGHPIAGKKDPLRAGVPFTCTSCHNPHGSAYRYLLIGDIRGNRVCALCHADDRK